MVPENTTQKESVRQALKDKTLEPTFHELCHYVSYITTKAHSCARSEVYRTNKITNCCSIHSNFISIILFNST